MTPSEKATFAHHDRIRAVPVGSHLLACEPFDALNNRAGGTVRIAQGATLRVTGNSGFATIECDAAMNGRIFSVGIFPGEFHCVEIGPDNNRLG